MAGFSPISTQRLTPEVAQFNTVLHLPRKSLVGLSAKDRLDTVRYLKQENHLLAKSNPAFSSINPDLDRAEALEEGGQSDLAGRALETAAKHFDTAVLGRPPLPSSVKSPAHNNADSRMQARLITMPREGVHPPANGQQIAA